MMMTDARLLSQLIVGIYTALSLNVNRTHVKKMNWVTYLYSLVIDQVYALYTKPNTDEQDHCTISPSR
jgi:hypothetical protein